VKANIRGREKLSKKTGLESAFRKRKTKQVYPTKPSGGKPPLPKMGKREV